MKLYFFPFVLLLATVAVRGQSNNPATFSALSARIQAINYGIPNEDLGEVSFTYALELGYRRQLGRYLGLNLPLRLGVIDVGELENPVTLGADLLAQFYPLGTEARLTPYLHAGVGVVTESFEEGNLQTPLGGGLNLLLGENSWLSLQAEYRLSNAGQRDNVQFGVGYIYRLSSLDDDRDGVTNQEDRCPQIAGPAATGGCPDTDGDGLADTEDRCPTVAGLRSLGGCPDRDNDGLADGDDACPNAAGPAATAGCPDADGDQVADRDDACPELPGPASLAGCPDADGDGVTDAADRCPQVAGDPDHAGCPDTDGDGRYDHEDECPTVAARTPNGCPAPTPRIAPPPPPPPPVTAAVQERLDYAAEAVEFETGSAKLKEKSYVILSEIGAILKQYPDYNLVISGHTDNVGSDATNLRLSERRAEACKSFLLATGIRDRRITYAGFGETRPRDTNDTPAGRRRNRRVEFELRPNR